MTYGSLSRSKESDGGIDAGITSRGSNASSTRFSVPSGGGGGGGGSSNSNNSVRNNTSSGNGRDLEDGRGIVQQLSLPPTPMLFRPKVVTLGFISFLLLVACLMFAGTVIKRPFHHIISSSKFNEEASSSSSSSSSSSVSGFTLSSPAFTCNATLPDAYTCNLGVDTGVSPPLAWKSAPEGTQEFFVTMLKKSGYSWSVYGIPSTVDHIDEDTCTTSLSKVCPGVIAGTVAWDIDEPPYIDTSNYVTMYKYEEPCSKGPGAKSYTFTVYAFSTSVAPVLAANAVTKADTTPTTILRVMDSYILGKATLPTFAVTTDTSSSSTDTTASSSSSSSKGGAKGSAGNGSSVGGGGGSSGSSAAATSASGAAATSPLMSSSSPNPSRHVS